MINLYNIFTTYIKEDWKAHPTRLVAEIYNWSVSAIGSLIFAITVPNPPFMVLYPLWLSGIFLMIFCVYSRGSVGLVALYTTLFLIDGTGYLKLILQSFQ